MKMYIEEFMKRFDYPKEAKEELTKVMEGMEEEKEALRIFEELLRIYQEDKDCDPEAIFSRTGEIAGLIDRHVYEVDALLLIAMTQHLHILYEMEGYSETMWEEGAADLKYKLLECRMVKGIWGNFVPLWEMGFFDLTRFAFGRLQFEVVTYDGRAFDDGKCKIASGQRVINVHVPRTGTSLTKEACDASYRVAKVFFEEKYQESLPFFIFSWILYPPYKKLFSPKANLYRFTGDYAVIGTVEDQSPDDNLWRLFDMDWTGDVNDYPEDTTLRRKMKEYLRGQGTTGSGYGVFDLQL